MCGSGVSRNSRCPCGSGKKFKSCHGRPGNIQSAPPLLLWASLGISLFALMAVLMIPGAEKSQVESPTNQASQSVHYSSIPGLDLSVMTAEDRQQLLAHLNHTPCVCDCNLTVAECRNIHSTCEHSGGLADASYRQLLAESVPSPAFIRSSH